MMPPMSSLPMWPPYDKYADEKGGDLQASLAAFELLRDDSRFSTIRGMIPFITAGIDPPEVGYKASAIAHRQMRHPGFVDRLMRCAWSLPC